MNRLLRPCAKALSATILAMSLAAGGALAQDSSAPAERQQGTDKLERNGPSAPPPGDTAKRPSKKASPLDLLMKDGIPRHAEKRAVLREDLYALLARGFHRVQRRRTRRLMRMLGQPARRRSNPDHPRPARHPLCSHQGARSVWTNFWRN